MRTAQAAYRPRVQNGTAPSRPAQAAPRRKPATRLRALPQQTVVARPRRRVSAKKQAAPLPNGMNVMSLLLLAGAAIGFMFIVALGWQRNAYGLAQQEVEMRSALDQAGDERQQLNVEYRRALNPSETTSRSEGAGLTDFKLDQRKAGVAAAKVSATNTLSTKAVVASKAAAVKLAPVSKAKNETKNEKGIAPTNKAQAR